MHRCEAFPCCLLSHTWKLDFMYSATIKVLAHSVQGGNLQCSTHPMLLWAQCSHSVASARWKHGLIPEGAATLELKIISSFPLAEEAPQNQWEPLQLALPPEKTVVRACPTAFTRMLKTLEQWNFQPWFSPARRNHHTLSGYSSRRQMMQTLLFLFSILSVL